MRARTPVRRPVRRLLVLAGQIELTVGRQTPFLALIVPLEVLGQFMRLISLSVRLFANMLAGHILILTFLGLIFIFQSWALVLVVLPATLFYLFEVIIVVGIQAFIFAALSAIYIGSAIEPEH